MVVVSVVHSVPSTLGGLKRNLEAGEIVSQVLTVQKALDATDERVSQIVIMGIGELLRNYDEMMDFLRIVNDDNSLKHRCTPYYSFNIRYYSTYL